MPATVPIEFFFGSISFIGALLAYVWHGLNTKINNIATAHDACPYPLVVSDIKEIKNDIAWIKDVFIKK